MENYTNYAIHWDDLTPEAKKRLIDLYDGDPSALLTVITKVDLEFEDLEETNYGEEL